MAIRKSVEDFLEKANKVHNSYYSYDMGSLKGKTRHDKITIICPVHGTFKQIMNNHLQGGGCKTCKKKQKGLANFLKKAKEVHEDFYDYSKVEYESAHGKVKITCPEHGEFEQAVTHHISGRGCSLCGKLKCAESNTKTTEEFIRDAKKVHGDKYDYSETVYKSSTGHLKIICPEHGLFTKTAARHLAGEGCKKCKIIKYTTEYFLSEAKKVHGSTYDYSKVVCNSSKNKVVIICPEHGDFEQEASKHLLGQGCNLCGYAEGGRKQRKALEDFIEEASTTHNGYYDYYKVVPFENTKSKVIIICPQHGEFKQEVSTHLSGKGCYLCGRELTSKVLSKSTEDFINDASKVHEGFYSYENTVYKNAKVPVMITCPKHGLFTQVASTHTSGRGCPSCACISSKPEKRIEKFLKDLGVDVIKGYRGLIPPYEVDLYLPEYNLAIEFNGLYWHSEEKGKDRNYHKMKTDMCRDKGVRLIHIWEDDFNSNEKRELDFLKYQLGLVSNEKVYARKLSVQKTIDKVEVKTFLENNHVQGYVNHSYSYGLFEGETLVALTCFTKRKDKFELVRYCTSRTVVGGLGKLVKSFSRDFHSNIYTFCDLTRFTGESYVKAGFKEAGALPPDYMYVVKDERKHKFGFRKDSIKNKYPEIYDPTLTEKEMMSLAGIPRIWDCGKVRYEYNID